MATITSTASGNASSGATWVGGVAPGPSDRAVIAAGHTVSVNSAVTWDSFEVAATGSLVIAAGGTLTFAASSKLNSATGGTGDRVRVEAGGTLACNPPVSTTATLQLGSDGAYYQNSLLRLAGTDDGNWIGAVAGAPSASAIAVDVTPATATLPRKGPRNFRAVVTGHANQAVTWSIQSGGGTINSHGRFVAPDAEGTVVVRAASVEDPTKYGEATVTVAGVVETGVTGSMDPPYPGWQVGWEGFVASDYITPSMGDIDLLPLGGSALSSLVTPVRDLPVSPYSDAIMQYFQAKPRLNGIGDRSFAVMSPGSGMGLNVVRSSTTPNVTLTYTGTNNPEEVNPIHSDPGPWPIPPTARVQGYPRPESPTVEWKGADGHLFVIDADTWNCYEAYRAHKNPASNDWFAYNGWSYNLVTGHWAPGVSNADLRYVEPGHHRFPVVIVNAAALPMLPLSVRYEELYAHQEIRHKIGVTLSNTKIGGTWVWPAQGMASMNLNRCADAWGPTIPYGATLRLREDWYRANVRDVSGNLVTGPSTPAGGWGPGALVMLKAYYEYGIINTDGGFTGDIWVVADSRFMTEDRWLNDLRHLVNCKMGAFEVVDFEDDLITVSISPEVAAENVERTITVTSQLWTRHPEAHPGNPAILVGGNRLWGYEVGLHNAATKAAVGYIAAGETPGTFGWGSMRGLMTPDHPAVAFKYTPNTENLHIFPTTIPLGIPYPYHEVHSYVVKTNEATLPITVALAPNPATIPDGGSQQFTATVTGTAAQNVLWTTTFPETAGWVSPLGGTGLFTDLGTADSGTVTARSRANQFVVGVANVTVGSPPPPAVSVTVSPEAVALVANATQQFAATVLNATDTSVVWSAIGAGTITPSGLFTAPAASGTTFIRATSNADPTKFAQATVTVPAPPPEVAPTPTPTPDPTPNPTPTPTDYIVIEVVIEVGGKRYRVAATLLGQGS